MSIEQNLERIANAVEAIAKQHGALPSAPALTPTAPALTPTAPAPELPAASLEPAAVTEPVLTPAQKGAATKAANKLIKDAQAAGSVPPPVQPSAPPVLEVVDATPPPGTGTVHPSMVGTLDALNQQAAPEGENPALVMPAIPATLEDMTHYAKAVASHLGPRVNEIAELLAGKYQVSRLPEMNAVHYQQFTVDLHELANRGAN